MTDKTARLPHWIPHRGPSGAMHCVKGLLRGHGLETVCENARCPNSPECFARSTATFMILGNTCTRRCRFCSVRKGRPPEPDSREPARLAAAAAELGLEYVVVTSVTRDDLPDGGASHFAGTLAALAERLPDVPVEILTPDFQGNPRALDMLLECPPAVFNHNIETVPRLYGGVRPGADYQRSLDLLEEAAKAGLIAKSGLMVGLGETDGEIAFVLEDLYRAGCRILTIGQYLRPSRESLPVKRFVEPDQFDFFARLGYKIGFKHVASGPLVRSSYRAHEGYRKLSV